MRYQENFIVYGIYFRQIFEWIDSFTLQYYDLKNNDKKYIIKCNTHFTLT